MEIPARADPSQPVDCFLAIRILHKRLASQVGSDPAPWFEIPQWQIDDAGRPDPLAYVFKLKLHERSKLTFSRALLTGELRAIVARGDSVRELPGWAWKNPKLTKYVWEEGRLPLDSRLPDEWWQWGNLRPALAAEAFNRWLESEKPQVLGSLPMLPLPVDRRNEPSPAMRQPPKAPFVTLTEALTWIAFGCAVDLEGLHVALDAGVFGDEAGTDAALASAAERLAKLATGSSIEMRGKYLAGFGADLSSATTKPIEAHCFHDFARFDTLYDGFAYGSGLTWPNSGLGRVFPSGRDDAYRAVLVNRAQLLEHFPAASANDISGASLKGGLASDEEIVAKMLELKATGVRRDEAAKIIRNIPGFESVGNEHARRLVAGKLGQGRPLGSRNKRQRK